MPVLSAIRRSVPPRRLLPRVPRRVDRTLRRLRDVWRVTSFAEEDSEAPTDCPGSVVALTLASHRSRRGGPARPRGGRIVPAVGLALVAPFIIVGSILSPLVHSRPSTAYPPPVVERPVCFSSRLCAPPMRRHARHAGVCVTDGGPAAACRISSDTVQYPAWAVRARGDGVRTAYQWVWIPNARRPATPAARLFRGSASPSVEASSWGVVVRHCVGEDDGERSETMHRDLLVTPRATSVLADGNGVGFTNLRSCFRRRVPDHARRGWISAAEPGHCPFRHIARQTMVIAFTPRHRCCRPDASTAALRPRLPTASSKTKRA